jgi:EAL domain-containing protein (putative c-di-GMP-specific phosphodiesterase class I)
VVKDDPIVALSRADTACYDIKNAGGGGVGIAKITQPVVARGKWQADYKRIRSIEAVISDGGFVLYGQPIVAIQNGQALHNRTELLLRLQEDGKIKLPREFLPLAERYRLGAKIDLWVINQVHYLITSGKLSLKNLNINLGMHSLNNAEVYRAVEALMNGLTEDWSICFELTEYSMVNSFVNAKAFTEMALSLGAKFAIDDFGDGYASFGMISKFPVDYIKIDGNLITKISQEPSKKAIVSSIQAIAESMNALTIAEHVPDETTLALLSEIGVHYVQSFYTGSPIPLDLG